MKALQSLIVGFVLVAAPAMAQQKKPVTLESLNAGPPRGMGMFGGAPLWAPDGTHYAERRGDKVMLVDAATGTEKELFSTAGLAALAHAPEPDAKMLWENRRVQEQRMQWSADGKKMLLVQGGDLFLWSEATGKVEQLTSTDVAERDPKFSPDGKMVSFRREFELYVIDVETKKAKRLTFDGSASRWNAMLDWVYPEELDLGTAHWWSPDSKHIAYLQFDIGAETMYGHIDHVQMAAVSEPQRYPKAGTPNAEVRLGVVDASGGATRWMDLGETRGYLLARVHWTPDSAHLLAHRLNRVQDHLWILEADIKSGTAKPLIEERDDAWVNITDDFIVLGDGRILRSSEKDGFRHLYLYGKDGRRQHQLTKGDWEVASIACVDQANEKVYFTSTEASPLERQLSVVGFNGKHKTQLTVGAGTHNVTMSPTCAFYQDSYSNLETPSRSALYSVDGKQVKVLREPDRKTQEEYDILPSEIVKFKGTDGTVFYGRLTKPAGFDAKKQYPLLVSVYGGPHAQSVRNAYSSSLGFEQVMAHKGFVIWAMDNRGSSGRGHKFETPLYRRTGKQELADQVEGVKYLVSQGYIDAARVGIYGWSYGGFMTVYALLHAPDVFQAGVAGAAVTDWRNYDTIYTERYMGLPEENPEGYKESSPVNAAANLKGKLLLLHNIEDDNVLFANFMQLTNAFQLAGRSYQSIIYPGKSHGVMGKARQHMTAEQVRFFEEALKK
jgi:dipeptidyl-peptidase-4